MARKKVVENIPENIPGAGQDAVPETEVRSACELAALVRPMPVQQPAPCPTYTLRADRRFDMLAMILITSLARAGKALPDRLAEVETTMRDFELWEERHA